MNTEALTGQPICIVPLSHRLQRNRDGRESDMKQDESHSSISDWPGTLLVMRTLDLTSGCTSAVPTVIPLTPCYAQYHVSCIMYGVHVLKYLRRIGGLN